MSSFTASGHYRISTRNRCHSIILLGVLSLFLSACQSSEGPSGSCSGAEPGSQIALECQRAADLALSRRLGY